MTGFTTGFGELRSHWRPLLAATIGVGSALSLNTYILSIFAPYLIDEFGWSRSQWAMLGLVQILVMVCLPVAGRLTDIYGVRRVAAIGAFSFPLFLVAITLMKGDITTYLAIYIAQTIVCSTTTTTVYSRVVAGAFRLKRGLALGICGSGPPLIGALGAPLLTAYVASEGWRAGYLAVAGFSAICAVLTLSLLPRGNGDTAEPQSDAAGAASAEKQPGVYRRIAANPAFWLMLAATFLANLPFAMATSQLKLVVLAQGLDDGTAAIMISAFAIGSIAGRVVSGLAIDAMPANVVAAISFGLPCAGLLLLASPADSMAVILVAVVLVGLSFGGEGDIVPFLVTRYFGLAVYGTVLGLMSAAMGTAMALGNALMGVVLARTESFDAYLMIAAAGSFAGALMFLMLGLERFRPRAAAPAVAA